MYNSYHHIKILKNDSDFNDDEFIKNDNLNENNDLSEYDIVGSLCENNDKFAINRVLYNKFKVNDYLIIYDAG
jgi:diaminopimelate decarboxylase